MSFNIYQENILDYYKHPRNKGRVADADVTLIEDNPLCGDRIEIGLKIDGDRISVLRYFGDGCAISQASASMLVEELEGKSVREAAAFSRDKLLEMLGVPLSPARLKCALLGLRTFKQALYTHLDKQKTGKADLAAIHSRLAKEGLIVA